MELANIKQVYFIGIGGIGMSALARYFAFRGLQVYGYDRTETKLTRELSREGIAISYADELASLPAAFNTYNAEHLVVFTPAIPQDSKILNRLRAIGYRTYKRSEVLGIISKDMYCIAVAGTHGKTTTSSMVAHLLKASGYDCSAFLGGIAVNYNSNMLVGQNAVMVVEADEYDRSFLTLQPNVAIITSTDADHLDIYGASEALNSAFESFVSQIKPGGTLFMQQDLQFAQGISYGCGDRAAIKAQHIRVQDNCFVFDYQDEVYDIKDLKLALPGKHNVENATAAIAVALHLGIAPEEVKQAIESYRGVKRRFEYIFKSDKNVYIDDYAHHPQELQACFAALRQLYPEKKLTAIFQPHLFSRTRDFMADFAGVLSTVDTLMLLDIYPAREQPITGVDSQALFQQIKLSQKMLLTKAGVLAQLAENLPELLVTVGAGDIDRLVEPINNIYRDVEEN